MKLRLLILLLTVNLTFYCGTAVCQSQQASSTFQNPIIKGFYPDPSVCRVGDDYYLVNSSFEYYPGVPIFHSKDLVNWRQIGHVLDRPSQLNLDTIRPSGGIFAPTIRYHNGTYYMITTLVGKKNAGNFYVTASSPYGPWSDPNWLPDAKGIDPSLFFDDDGKVYYTGNVRPDSKPADSKYRQIWIQELDLNSKKLIGEPKIILEEGAMHNVNNAEASHMYKKDGYYYLMIAEGGTEMNHAVTIFRSKNVYGPFEGNKKNPIITHRSLGQNYPVCCTGHADLVETQKGDWAMVLLGVRIYGGFHYNLGRETFLTSIAWEDNWPVVNPGEAKVLLKDKRPNLPQYKQAVENTFDQFDHDTLFYYWTFLRTPRTDFWSLKDRKGYLRLHLRPETVMEAVSPSIIVRRQQGTSFVAETLMDFTPVAENEVAGLVVMMNNNYQFRMEKKTEGGKPFITVTKRFAGNDEVLAKKQVGAGNIVLGVKAIGQSYSFYFKQNNKQQTLAAGVDGRTLSRINTGGFTGTMIGMYGSSNGKPSNNVADFGSFNYKQL